MQRCQQFLSSAIPERQRCRWKGLADFPGSNYFWGCQDGEPFPEWIPLCYVSITKIFARPSGDVWSQCFSREWGTFPVLGGWGGLGCITLGVRCEPSLLKLPTSTTAHPGYIPPNVIPQIETSRLALNWHMETDPDTWRHKAGPGVWPNLSPSSFWNLFKVMAIIEWFQREGVSCTRSTSQHRRSPS